MPKISIEKAEPGQTLSRPAVTRTGMVMMQPGTQLTAAIIDRLKNLGIDSVIVEGASRIPDKPLDVMLRELDERFQGNEHDSWMMELKAIVADIIRSRAGSS
jgi:hypothetical protein